MAKSSVISGTHHEDDYQCQRDLECLLECARIEADPKRMAKVRAMAKKRMLGMAKVASEGASD